MFGGDVWSMFWVFRAAISLAKDISYDSFSKCLGGVAGSPSHWAAPSLGFLKLNVDRSAFMSLHGGGFGQVIQDHEGKWVAGFLGKLLFWDVLRAEIMSILQGLQFA